MRENIGLAASLAGSAAMTALAILIPDDQFFWKLVLVSASGVLALCALALFLDITRKWRGKDRMVPLIGMAIFGAGFILCGVWYFWPGSLPMKAIPTASSERRLSRPQKLTLSEELKRLGWQPKNVTLRYFNGCMECLQYASAIAEALRWAGWAGQNDTTFDSNPELTGVQMVVENLRERPHDAELLASALAHAGIEFQWSTWEPPLITPVILFVYPKPS